MIYILSNDPQECAKLLDDRSIGKMISDIAQVLCNVHYMHLVTMTYKDEKRPVIPMLSSDYFNCEWSQWASACLANYNLLLAYARACCMEWCYRSLTWDTPKRKHKHHEVIWWCESNKPDLPDVCVEPDPDNPGYIIDVESKPTPLPLVMPDKYIICKPRNPLIFGTQSAEPCVVESYRNYYRAKLTKKIDKKVFELTKENKLDELCKKEFMPTWTRREIPEFLGDL